MDQNFNNDEFDSFLKHTTDEFLMYPTETVWNRIKKNLFWRKNWFSVAGSVLVLCLLFFIPESFLNGIFINYPTTGNPASDKSTGDSNSVSAPFSSAIKFNHLRSVPGNISSLIIADPSFVTSATSQKNTPENHVAGNIPFEVHGEKNFLRSVPVEKNTTELDKTDIPNLNSIHSVTSSASLNMAKTNYDIDVTSHFTTTRPVEQINNPEDITATAIEELPQEDEGIVNFLRDQAVIKLTPKKQGRFNLQFYFSPLISYRSLTDNNNKPYNTLGNTPLATNQININQFVDHQPSIGVEMGSNLLFKVTKNITLKSGLQMNYSRYAIKAYRAPYQKASIALSSYGSGGDTITSYTTIRNFDGYLQEQLQNQYLQLSVPIGAEVKLLGNKRLQLNIAGTIQPTLLLLNDAYLLSTDYLNYTKEPSLVRKWNVHTSAEAYISYQFANVRWQVGPQFRYQLLSSFNDRYPIHEYLMEYGIKFGISKTLK